MMLILRSLVFNICFYLWTAFIVIKAIPGFWSGRRPIHNAAHLWGRGINWFLKHLCHISVEFRGRHYVETGGPVIVAAKHQSTWETTNIEYLVPDCAIILKRELTFIPLFGQLLLKAGMISVHRQKGQSTLPQMVAGARRCLDEGRSLLIFPEGTRRHPDAPPKYRYGIFPIYTALNVPVIPAAHNAGYFWGRRRFLKKPGKIIFEFLPPIEPGLDEKTFFAQLESRIEEACDRIKPVTVTDLGPRKSSVLKTALWGIAGLFILYTAAWFYGERQLRGHITHCQKTAESRGFTLNLTEKPVFLDGFPGSVSARFGAGSVTHSGGQISFQGLRISISPLAPKTPRFDVDQGQFSFENNHITIHHLDGKIGMMAQNQIQFTLHGRAITTSFIFPRRVDNAYIVLTVPPVFDSLDGLYQRGDTVEIQKITASLNGVNIDGDGTVTLDENRQPAAAFSFDVKGLDQMLVDLKNAHIIDQTAAALIQLPLAFFKKPSDNGDGEYRKIPLTLQDQTLFLGPVPIAKIPSFQGGDSIFLLK